MFISDYLKKVGHISYIVIQPGQISFGTFKPEGEDDINAIQQFADSLAHNFKPQELEERLANQPYRLSVVMRYAVSWRCAAMLNAHEMKLSEEQSEFVMLDGQLKDWAMANPGKEVKLAAGIYYLCVDGQLYRIEKGYEYGSKNFSKPIWRVFEENRVPTGIDHMPIDWHLTLKKAIESLKEMGE